MNGKDTFKFIQFNTFKCGRGQKRAGKIKTIIHSKDRRMILGRERKK